MTRRLGVARGCLAFLLCYSVGLAYSKCCEKKVVPGISSKAGTYNLVSTSEKLPDFCLGGCIYTKEGDPSQPVTNYCFQEGEGDATCSGAGCGGGEGGGREVEGWIEKYFERECSMQINGVLKVSVRKQYSYGQQSCGSNNYGLTNVSVEVYDKPACEGTPIQIGMAEGTYGYAQAVFLIKVKDTKPWSVFLSKEGFKSACNDIGLMVPFSQYGNSFGFSLEEEQTESTIIPTVSLNFTFAINTELLSDVFVQGNPASCVNYRGNFPPRSKKRSNTNHGKSRQKQRDKKEKKKKKNNSDYDFFMSNPSKILPRSHGSGSGSGGGGGSNSKCYPTCKYTSWNTDPLLTPCICKGVIGGGMNLSDMSLPNQQTPAGKAIVTGSLYWYNDTSIPPNRYPPKLYTTFAEFTRRNTTSVMVCDSKLAVSIESIFLKTVPCFDPQIPLAAPIPTFPSFPGQSGITPPGFAPGMFTPDSPLGSGSGSGSGSSLPWPTSYPQWLTTADQEDMFSEVDGVLFFGKSDRFWIFGCMPEDSVDKFLTFAVDFFTSKDPRETPEFCGCLLTMIGMGGNAEVSKEQVKECYVKALTGGPSQRTAQTWSRSKMTKKKQRQLQKKFERRLENEDKRVLKRMKKLANRGRTGFTGNAKENLKKFLKKKKQKQNPLFPRRSRRDASDQNMIDDDEEENYPQDVDFVDFENEEYKDYFDEYEEIEDDEFTDYATSSGWNFL